MQHPSLRKLVRGRWRGGGVSGFLYIVQTNLKDWDPSGSAFQSPGIKGVNPHALLSKVSSSKDIITRLVLCNHRACVGPQLIANHVTSLYQKPLGFFLVYTAVARSPCRVS